MDLRVWKAVLWCGALRTPCLTGRARLLCLGFLSLVVGFVAAVGRPWYPRWQVGLSRGGEPIRWGVEELLKGVDCLA